MQSVMVLDCFVQKLSKKNLWSVGLTPPPPTLVKEGLRLCYKKRIFKQIVWTGVFSVKATSNTKNYHLVNIRHPIL